MLRQISEDIPWQLVRSRRKTLAIEIRRGEVIVRAPMRMPMAVIRTFVISRQDWIRDKLEKQSRQQTFSETEAEPALTQDEIKSLTRRAAAVIPERVAHYAPRVGVTCGRITIRCQKTRWGSCSSKGNLNFNCLLMLAPPEVLDSVVVHELCHRKEMNHSRRFYEEVLRVFPEYHKWNGWLKKNGNRLMARVHRL